MVNAMHFPSIPNPTTIYCEDMPKDGCLFLIHLRNKSHMS